MTNMALYLVVKNTATSFYLFAVPDEIASIFARTIDRWSENKFNQKKYCIINRLNLYNYEYGSFPFSCCCGKVCEKVTCEIMRISTNKTDCTYCTWDQIHNKQYNKEIIPIFNIYQF